MFYNSLSREKATFFSLLDKTQRQISFKRESNFFFLSWIKHKDRFLPREKATFFSLLDKTHGYIDS
jgi:hypothetical protein